VEFTVPFSTVVAAQRKLQRNLHKQQRAEQRAAALLAQQEAMELKEEEAHDVIADERNVERNYSPCSLLYGPVALALAAARGATSGNRSMQAEEEAEDTEGREEEEEEEEEEYKLDDGEDDVGAREAMDTEPDSPSFRNYSPTGSLYGPAALQEASWASVSRSRVEDIESGRAASERFGGPPLVRGTGAVRYFPFNEVCRCSCEQSLLVMAPCVSPKPHSKQEMLRMRRTLPPL